MDRYNMVRRMLEAIPNLVGAYDELVEWYAGDVPGLHVIVGDVLDPYLMDLLRADGQETALVEAFQLLEEMATSADVVVQEVLATTVLERLGDERPVLEKARGFMGPATRRLSEDVERGWGRE